jgi:hypothetical protein
LHNVGSSLAASQLVQLVALFGKQALQSKDAVNGLFGYAVILRHGPAMKSMQFLASLL